LFLLLPHYARSFRFCFLILAAFPFQEKEEGRRNITIKTKEEGAFEIEKNSEIAKRKVLRKVKKRRKKSHAKEKRQTGEIL